MAWARSSPLPSAPGHGVVRALSTVLSAVVLCAVSLAPSTAAAQDDDVDWGFQGGASGGDGGEADGEGDGGPAEVDLALEQPGRVLGRLGGGIGIRLGTDAQYDQETLAPAFLDLMAGYVFSGSGQWRHGATLGVSVGLTPDGPPAAEIGAFGQYALSLGYLAYFRFGMDTVVGARIGPVLSLGFQDSVNSMGQTTSSFVWAWGGEVAAHVQYNLLAGFGLYADVGVALFAGAASSVHPVLGVSAGVVIDYELLP